MTMTRQVQTDATFQRRIMRRVIPLIVITFMVLAITSIFALQSDGRRVLRQESQQTLLAVDKALGDELNIPINELATIANSNTARTYARLFTGSQVVEVPRAQQETFRAALLNLFDDFITRNRDDFLSIRFITPEGIVSDELVNNGGQSTLNPLTQPDSLIAQASFAAALRNPPGEVFLGATSTAGGITGTDSLFLYTTVASVDNDAAVAGLLQLEISRQSLVIIFEDILDNPAFSREGRNLLLVNNQNAVIAQSGQTHLDNQALERFLADNPGAKLQASAGEGIVLTTTDASFDASGEDTPWHIVVEDNLAQALSSTNNLSVAVAVGFLLVTVGLLFAINSALYPVVRPLNQATDFAQRLAEKGKAREVPGMSRLPAPLARIDDTELGQLVGAIGDISAHITQLNAALDLQIKRRSRDLDIAVHIERETAAARDLDSSLKRILTLICETLGLYHAQIFLADDIGATLLLTHSRGKVGQRLIEKNIKISVSSDTPIARAAQLRSPQTASEVSIGWGSTSDPYLLPDTRTRIAVPLVVENQLLGVLDIQGNEATPLNTDDLPTFMLLGNQLANLVHQVRDVSQLNRQIAQMDALNRQLTRSAWEQTEEQNGLERTYQYNLMDVERLPLTVQPSSGLSTPISVRGEMIGELNVHPTDGQAFTEGDALVLRAVAERVSLAIENARLFQETQTSLQETSTLYQLSRYLNEADSLYDVIQSIIYAVMPDAAGGQVWIFDEYGSTQRPRWMEIAADVNSVHRNPGDQDLIGLRLFVPDHPFINTMQSNQVTVITNLEQDTRPGPGLKAVFERMQAQAIVFIPLTVRGVWRGLITLEYAAAREFNESEGRTFSALIDQAGVAIDNRLLLQQTETALTQNENLYAASRIINTAQNTQDLVYAAVATNTDSALSFSLSVLEGALDETGWPTQARVVAQSDGMTVKEMDFLHPIFIPPNSPMRVREPEIVTDLDPSDPDVSTPVKWIRSQGHRFMAVFPLFSANQPLALFQINSSELRELNAGDYDVYRALTGQMSSQLQIRRLLVSTEQALDETRRLYIASRSITSAQDSFMVYQAAIEHLARPLLQAGQSPQIVTISVLLAWPDATPYAPYLEYVYNWSSEHDTNPASLIGQQLNSDEYPYGRLTEEAEGLLYFNDLNRPSVLGDPINDEPHLRDILLQQGASSVVVVPIQTRMKWFGVLIAQSDQPNAFSEQYQRFLQAVTDQVSIAVENQRLFTEAQNEARRAQSEAQRAIALAEAAGLASRIGSDFRRSLGEVFERVAEEAGFDRWILLLKTPESDNLLEKITAVAPNYSLENDVRVLDLSTELPIVDAVRINRSLTVNSPAHYPAFRELPAAEIRALEDFYGKHIVMPVTSLVDASEVLGALMMGRSITSDDLDERDEQLVAALAAQVAVALENRRLFDQTQTEQKTLRSILSTLPTGVLVLDAETLLPIQFNDQAEAYLRRKIDPTQPFSSAAYNLYRTGTLLHYPQDEMPIFAALKEGQQVFQDDVAIINGDLQTDLLVYAAPILDAQGTATAIVAAFQDISNLRSLENTLQENLRETVALSEAQRLLSEAAELDEVMRITLEQISTIAPTDAYILLADTEGADVTLGQALNHPPDELWTLHTLLDDLVIVRVGDSQTAFLDSAGRATLDKLGMRDFISIPLRARSRPKPLGWFIVVSAEPDYFTYEHERLIDQLGDITATAIDNRLLIREQQAALQEASALYQATTRISRARDTIALADILQDALTSLDPDYALGFIQPESGIKMGAGILFTTLPPNIPRSKGEATSAKMEALMKAHFIAAEGVYIEDVMAIENGDPFQKDLMKIKGINALVAINLRIKDSSGGWLVMGYHNPRLFNDSVKRYLNTVADSASVVVDNIVLFDQIQSTLDETSILYQANRALRDASSSDEIINVVVNHLIAPHVNQVFIMLLEGRSWEEPHATAQVVASWSQENNVDFMGITLNHEQFPAWTYLNTPTVFTIDDIFGDPTMDLLVQMGLQSMDMHSLAIIPLRVPKRTIGAIWLGSQEAHVHTERETRIYQAFAEQASLSMEAAFLLAQTERRARQLETSASVSQSAGQILDLEILMPQLVNLIRDAFRYDHVQIFLLDEPGEFAELRASTGDAGQQLLGIKHKLKKGSQSVIGQVIEHAVPQIALDIAASDVVHAPNPYLPLTRSEMALPLSIKGRVVGALDVQSNRPNAFGDEDVSVLTTLAAQISVALENANLYEAAQQQADKMGFLFEITNTAAAADTLDEALQNVAERLHTSLNASSTAIYLTRLYSDVSDNIFRTLKVVALAGSSQPLSEIEEIRQGLTRNLVSTFLEETNLRVIEDIHDELRYLPIAPEARSAILLPLISGGELIGLVSIEDNRLNAFGYETQQLLVTMSRTLSAIIQSAQLIDQLQKTTEQLRELDRLKSDFLANMSHELRTPLNSIIGFSRVMLKGIDGPLTEMQEQDLSTIYNSGQHLLVLINDVLDQAKIAAGKMDMKFAYFEVKPLIEGVRSIGVGLLKDKPISLQVEIANSLPKAYGDEFRTRQVLLNLVSNASKFTQEGLVTLRVYPTTDVTTNRLMIRVDVIDSGIGIAESDLPLLFEAFRQVDSSLTRTQGGTGLGLPIAKSLIELQGGQMQVTSQVNVGSTFSIILPTEPAPVQENPTEDSILAFMREDPITPVTRPTLEISRILDMTPSSRPDGMPRAVPLNGPSARMMQAKRQVLLIEDNKDMVDQFRRALQREGFEVQTADHPAYAEAMVSNLRPNVIVMDVNFAGGEGWNILTRLKDRDDTFDLPVIVVTLSDQSEKAYLAGAYAFIQRPFMPDQLVEAALEAEKESNTERILIIDDQPNDIRLLTQVLNESGNYRVFSAHSGVEGIGLVARRRPDLIILDLRMPEMDGFAVLQELRSNPETANIPVMVVTGEISLNASEQERLANIHVLQKTDISEEDYAAFIDNVRGHLGNGNGHSYNGERE